MKWPQDNMYRKGYIAGYRDGIASAAGAQTTEMVENDFTNLPVYVMGISTRACNCLIRAGCTRIADVVALSESKILRMRNMGDKTAAEIAGWLEENGIRYSAWHKYL